MVAVPLPKAAVKPKAITFGACNGEDTHHDRCRQAVRQPGGLVVCNCPGHADEPTRCVDCSGTDVIDSVTHACTDRYACSARIDERRRNNPLSRQLAEVVAAGQRVRQTERERRMAKTEAATADRPAPAAVKAPRAARAKTGRCHHCGEPTKGGLFAAGHDAKLKGVLQKAAHDPSLRRADRVSAAAELLARGWVKPAKPIPADLSEDANRGVEGKNKEQLQAVALKYAERRWNQ